MKENLIERLERCAKDCEVYSPDVCATLIEGIGNVAMRHLLREAAAALASPAGEGASSVAQGECPKDADGENARFVKLGGVGYVRADLATPPPAPAAEQEK